jgi:hypothetical protein
MSYPVFSYEEYKDAIDRKEYKEIINKIAWENFPFSECEEVVRVFTYGVSKYGKPFTYRNGIRPGLLWSAIMRHMVMIHKGELIDSESGLTHYAHIAANALMAISQYCRNESNDS